MGFRRHLFIPNKLAYIRGKKRPKVECILCAIVREDPAVDNLLIWRNDLLALCANLYPYNAGHLLLFPLRHIRDPRELTFREMHGMFILVNRCLEILDSLYEPCGFNIGFNVGDASGASIPHLHQHLVPRYPKELGFVDVVGGAKIIIEDPSLTMQKLRAEFAGFNLPGDTAEEGGGTTHKKHRGK